MKRYDIVTKGKPYNDKTTGQEKFSFRNVGTLVEGIAQASGKPFKILELYMFPNTEFIIFEQKDRNSPTTAKTPPTFDTSNDFAQVPTQNTNRADNSNGFDYGEPINPDDIPF